MTKWETITVAKSSFSISDSYSATIEGRQDIEIFPQITGKIEKICITEGQTVTKGTPLFIIDQVPYQAALRLADADVTFAEASLESAKLEYEGKKALCEAKVVSEYDLQLSKNDYAKSEAQLEQAKARQINASNDLSYTVVKSPVNGVVGTIPFRAGTLVGPSMDQPLTTVSDNAQMYVYFSIGEAQLRKMISKYGSVKGIIDNMPSIQLYLSDGTKYEQAGKIESISGVVNSLTGTVSVRAVFPNEKRLLLSGSLGRVSISSEHESAILIPQSAVFEIQGKYFVHKVIDGKASIVEVAVTSDENGLNYLVSEGLEEGDVIVGSGAGLVKDGDVIQ